MDADLTRRLMLEMVEHGNHYACQELGAQANRLSQVANALAYWANTLGNGEKLKRDHAGSVAQYYRQMPKDVRKVYLGDVPIPPVLANPILTTLTTQTEGAT